MEKILGSSPPTPQNETPGTPLLTSITKWISMPEKTASFNNRFNLRILVALFPFRPPVHLFASLCASLLIIEIFAPFLASKYRLADGRGMF